jgi:hypothetical protein
MEQKRLERREQYEEQKEIKERAKQAAKDAGKICDFDFDQMISHERQNAGRAALNHVKADSMQISVCVRKRPIFEKETAQGEIDAVSVFNPRI